MPYAGTLSSCVFDARARHHQVRLTGAHTTHCCKHVRTRPIVAECHARSICSRVSNGQPANQEASRSRTDRHGDSVGAECCSWGTGRTSARTSATCSTGRGPPVSLRCCVLSRHRSATCSGPFVLPLSYHCVSSAHCHVATHTRLLSPVHPHSLDVDACALSLGCVQWVDVDHEWLSLTQLTTLATFTFSFVLFTSLGSCQTRPSSLEQRLTRMPCSPVLAFRFSKFRNSQPQTRRRHGSFARSIYRPQAACRNACLTIPNATAEFAVPVGTAWEISVPPQ